MKFIAISGDSRPSHAHIAKFVSALGEQIKALFAQVLMTCDAQGLIGREMLAIDGVKLSSHRLANGSKGGKMPSMKTSPPFPNICSRTVASNWVFGQLG